jgi:hypothetical protein
MGSALASGSAAAELHHLLGRDPRSWVLTIEGQRTEVDDVLTDNPGLKPRIAEAIARAYRRARIEAAKEAGLEKKAFPDTCPFSWDDIVAREFER